MEKSQKNSPQIVNVFQWINTPLSQKSQMAGSFTSFDRSEYLNLSEDYIKISLNRIWWKSTDKRCKRRFFRKRSRSSISMSSATTSSTPPSSAIRSPIVPNRRSRFQAILHLETKNETESNSIDILPWAITKTVVKFSATSTVEVVRHVGRTEHRP